MGSYGDCGQEDLGKARRGCVGIVVIGQSWFGSSVARLGAA